MEKARSDSTYAGLEPARNEPGGLRGWWRRWRGHAAPAPAASAPQDAGPAEPREATAEPGEAMFPATATQTLTDEAPWSLRRIQSQQSAEFEQLVELVMASPGYRQQTQGRDPQRSDAVALLAEAPEGTRPQQKYLWGLWHGERMVGCLEVIRGWPEAHYVYIGFLLVDERERRHGHANAALRLLAQRSRQWAGIRRWRLAVVESQGDAQRFWRQAGFVPTGQKVSAPQYRVPLVVMERGAAR